MSSKMKCVTDAPHGDGDEEHPADSTGNVK